MHRHVSTTRRVGRPADRDRAAQADVVAPRGHVDLVPPRMLRFPVVRERTGLSRTTVWRMERRGEFPAHCQLSANTVGWLEEEVTAWIRSRSGSPTDGEPRDARRKRPTLSAPPKAARL